ncbi:hypothetical protein BVRB_1g005580 [Beta vulgaris subsp. vulgaris]|nr:hypothetical protein BVRB_1g005580 [Beta vulgaris subsp. vulgaris]
MEGKKNLLAIILILALVQMMAQKGQGCSDVGQGCGLFTRCCAGSLCSDKLGGGTCERDPNTVCRSRGESCGFFVAQCCGTLVCSSTVTTGVCQ